MEKILTEAVLDIKQWGNNLRARLPDAVAREAHLHVDQCVCVSVEGDKGIITPLETQSSYWSSAWLPTILNATAANKLPQRKRWEPSVGSCHKSSVRKAQTLDAGATGHYLD